MKIGNLYNLASFDAMSQSIARSGFADAYAGTVLERNLTHVDPQLFTKKYPELSFVSSGIVADNTGGYARIIQSLRKREQGSFRTAGDKSSNRGHISMSAEDSSLKVREREAESDWTDSEVKEAALQNINLISDYISAHNTVYMREIDEAGYLGIADVTASTGLLNYAGFTSQAAGGTYDTLTAQQLYDVFADNINAQWNAVNNTPEYKANKIDMPIYVLNHIQVVILNTAAGPMSVLSALKANFPGVDFRGTFRADNAGGAGVSHTAIYSNNSEAMKMRIPVPLTIGEILKRGSFSYHVDSKYRIAGLDILEDTAGYLVTGL